MSATNTSRRHRPTLEARLVPGEDGEQQLTAPAVGLWREAPALGALVRAGDPIGVLEILGQQHLLRAPAGAGGLVTARISELARAPVAFGDALLTLDPEATAGVVAADPGAAQSSVGGGLVFRSPTSGRFYARPAPDKDPFVTPGEVIEAGHTVALLEVMKTFNRVQLGGPGLPARVKVLRVVPDNESDVESGDVLLELEPA